MYKENNSPSLWFYILSTISGFLIVYFAWRAHHHRKKRTQKQYPQIGNINIKNDGCGIITIVNYKSHNVPSPTNIFYKKKTFVSFLKKYNPISLKGTPIKPQPAPAFTDMDKLKEELKARMKAQVPLYIEANSQAIFTFKVPNFDYKATYKIVVKILGEKCQPVYTSIQDLTHNKSN